MELSANFVAQMDQYGRGPYQEKTHNICPVGYNGQRFYACSSSAPDEGLIDHFVISDPSFAPESIETINWQAANGQITEHEQFARVCHSQNQQIVQQQMQQYQAQYMAAQQYWALQQQLMEQRMAAMKLHYHSQFGDAFAQGWSLSGIPLSVAYNAPKNYAPAPAAAPKAKTAAAPSKPKTLKKTYPKTQYVGTSQQSNAGTSVYSAVSPSCQLENVYGLPDPKYLFPLPPS